MTRTGFALLLSLATVIPAAYAQDIIDPTRPPPGVIGDEITEEAVRGPVLQSIIIRPHRRMAIISGERVEVGGRFREARVTAIRENEVVLRSAIGTEVLRLYPDVDVKLSKGAKIVRKPARSRN